MIATRNWINQLRCWATFFLPPPSHPSRPLQLHNYLNHSENAPDKLKRRNFSSSRLLLRKKKKKIFFNFHNLSPCSLQLMWSFMASTWAQWNNSMNVFPLACLRRSLTPNLHIFHISHWDPRKNMNKNISLSLSKFSSKKKFKQEKKQHGKIFFTFLLFHFTINFIVCKCTINSNLNGKFSTWISRFPFFAFAALPSVRVLEYIRALMPFYQ